MAAKGYSYEGEALAAVVSDDLTAAWFDHESHSLGDDAPGCVVSEPLVWEGALSPSTVGKAKARVFVRKVGYGGFDHAPVDPACDGRLSAPRFQ